MNGSDTTEIQKEDQIFVLGKLTEFFYERQAPPVDSWPDISEQTGLNIVCAAADHRDDGSSHWDLPVGIESTGHLSKEEFAAAMGKSRVMLAIGRPEISPSPYEAL